MNTIRKAINNVRLKIIHTANVNVLLVLLHLIILCAIFKNLNSFHNVVIMVTYLLSRHLGHFPFLITIFLY